jgi:aryl-alcohol dehydrogenase-like predicted oxidoreductase
LAPWLDTYYIDIYYMHAPDYDTKIEESLDTMTSLVRSGKMHYIGMSNYAAWQVADILAASDRHGFVAPVITQNVYNPITRGVEGSSFHSSRRTPWPWRSITPSRAGASE